MSGEIPVLDVAADAFVTSPAVGIVNGGPTHTGPVRLCTANASRRSVRILNYPNRATVYFGPNASVTYQNGFPLPSLTAPPASITPFTEIELNVKSEIWANVPPGSSTAVSVIEFLNNE